MSKLVIDRPLEREGGREIVMEREAPMKSFFQGPLGLWPWPMINLILTLSNRPGRYGGHSSPRRRLSIYTMERDEKGRITALIEREVNG